MTQLLSGAPVPSGYRRVDAVPGHAIMLADDWTLLRCRRGLFRGESSSVPSALSDAAPHIRKEIVARWPSARLVGLFQDPRIVDGMPKDFVAYDVVIALPRAVVVAARLAGDSLDMTPMFWGWGRLPSESNAFRHLGRAFADAATALTTTMDAALRRRPLAVSQLVISEALAGVDDGAK